ncbi:helix-turn-helix domain-containing protein [Alienimonas sp. DA493]|uniref:helix-turn-helix domain-containing protein n=1 Tax=Alienimonas sp. DA493 TaxID=3373605 RepID=UPI003754329E
MPDTTRPSESTSPCPLFEPADSLLNSLDDTLTLPEVADRLNVHSATAYRWTRHGVGGVKLRYLQVGGRQRRVTKADLAAFIEELTRRSCDAVVQQPRPARAPANVEAATGDDRTLAADGW